MRPAPFFVSGPVPVPVHCTGAGRSSGSGTVRLLRFGFRARFRSSLPLSRRSRLSRASGPASVRAAPSCAVALSAHSALPSLCNNMAGAFLSACLSSFPDIASNLRGISYFLPAFVVSMCLWIYSVSRSGVSRSVLRCISAPCLLLFSWWLSSVVYCLSSVVSESGVAIFYRGFV